jgi:kinesin family protein 18/19
MHIPLPACPPACHSALKSPALQAVRLQELKFQMAVRDQIISEQRDVISNLWAILGASGLTRRQVMDIARTQGIVMQVGA